MCKTQMQKIKAVESIDELGQKALDASLMLVVAWSSHVEDAIELFKQDLQLSCIDQDRVQICPVALHSEHNGISLLHLLAQHCPLDRKGHFIQLLQNHHIDTNFLPIYTVLVNDCCLLAR